MPIITDTNLKAFLKPGGLTGAQNDTVVTWAVNAANQAVVQYCARNFDKVAEGAETARVYYPDDACRVVVDDLWSTLNLVVKTDEGDDGTYETTWTVVTDYQLEPLNGREDDIAVPYYQIDAVGFSRRFPTRNRRPSVQVTAAWGWTAVPAAVTQAALIKAARLFHRKDSPQGVAGFDNFGAVRLSKSEDGDVMSLLEPFRRVDRVVGIA